MPRRRPRAARRRRARPFAVRGRARARPRSLRQGGSERMSEAILFDRDRVERLNDIADRPKRLRGSELLWVDVDRGSDEDVDRVADAFGLDRETRECLATSKDRAIFRDHGRYIHVTTYAPDEDDEGELISLECVVGERWVVTAHDNPIPVLAGVRREGLRLGRHGLAGRPRVPCGAPGVGARVVLGRVRADRAPAGGFRRRRDARRQRCREGHRAADRDAARGGEPPARACGSPLSARVADASRAGGAR